MKNKLCLVPLALLAFASSSNGQTTFLEGAGGTIAGSNITYTFSGANGGTGVNDPTPGSGDLQTAVQTGSVITITFVGGPVDFFINPVSTEGTFGNVNFDTVGETNVNSDTFVADAGVFTFTDTAGGPTLSASGSTLSFDGTEGPFVSDAFNFGSASISGITQITYTVPDVSNFEAFNFSAAASVPEPTSSILLGLGLLGFGIRRKR